MRRLANGLDGHGDLISSDRIDEIGLALCTSYASIEIAAAKLKMTKERLTWLIRSVPELTHYFEIAHEGIKTLTDKQILTGLMEGDKDIVKMVFNKIYSGRGKGGYNPSEIGTTGYKDPLSKKLAAETESDRKKQNVQVNFNFVQKEIRTEFAPVEIEGKIIDAEEVPEDEE